MLGMRMGLYMSMPGAAQCIQNDKVMEELNGTLGMSNAYFFNPEAPNSAVDAWKEKVGPMFMAIEAKMKAEGWMHVAGNTVLPADF